MRRRATNGMDQSFVVSCPNWVWMDVNAATTDKDDVMLALPDWMAAFVVNCWLHAPKFAAHYEEHRRIRAHVPPNLYVSINRRLCRSSGTCPSRLVEDRIRVRTIAGNWWHRRVTILADPTLDWMAAGSYSRVGVMMEVGEVGRLMESPGDIAIGDRGWRVTVTLNGPWLMLVLGAANRVLISYFTL